MADIEKQGRRRRRRAAEVEEEIESAEEVDAEDDVEEVRGITAAKGRATPGRRNTALEAEESGNFITRPIGGLREYFQGVRSELEKVTWPTREETLRLVRIVLAVMVATSIILGLLGLAFTTLFQVGLEQPLWFVAFFVLVGAIVAVYIRANRNATGTDASSNYNSRLF